MILSGVDHPSQKTLNRADPRLIDPRTRRLRISLPLHNPSLWGRIKSPRQGEHRHTQSAHQPRLESRRGSGVPAHLDLHCPGATNPSIRSKMKIQAFYGTLASLGGAQETLQLVGALITHPARERAELAQHKRPPRDRRLHQPHVSRVVSSTGPSFVNTTTCVLQQLGTTRP